MTTTNYPATVIKSIESIDVQRFGAGADPADRPATIVARTRVRYSYPDAPDTVHLLAFSSERDGRVYVTRSGFGRGVYVDAPERFGDFTADPFAWVGRFYGEG